MIEKLVPKNVELNDFLKEIKKACNENEKFNALSTYKNSNTSTYSMFSNIHSFFCLLLGSLLAYMFHDFQIWMSVLFIVLFIGVLILDKFMNDILEENEIVTLAIADIQYDVMFKILKTTYKANLSDCTKQ
jgi:MFS-type transporter involved in bile tolerance (Atg22 family)